jgi:Ca2+-binding RTX toxin-like protein
MKNPIKFSSDAFVRSARRDTIVGTAVLILLETGLLGTAAAMSAITAEPEEPKDHGAGGDPARKGRPLGGSEPLPDMHIDMVGNPGIDRSDNSDDDFSGSADFSDLDVGALRHSNETDLAAFAHIGLGVAGAGHLAGGNARSVAQGGSHGGQFGGSAGAASDDSGMPFKPVIPPSQSLPGDDANVVLGTDGNDIMQGTGDNDYLFGRDGADLLLGLGGNDRLLGGNGNDTLSGGAGKDFLVGDKGDDEMTGGAGADTFLFRSGYGHDTITDFKTNGDLDVISVAKSEFADFAALSHNLTATDAGVMLTLHDGSTLTLSHVTLSSLTANDFRFEV